MFMNCVTERIEEARERLDKLVVRLDVDYKQILKVSQELDKLISLYYKLNNKETAIISG